MSIILYVHIGKDNVRVGMLVGIFRKVLCPYG